jgi:hypothetical protein
VISVIGLNWIATERAAAVMHYAPFLSGRLVAHVYQPFAWWSWEARWPHAALQVGRSIIPLQPIWHTCEYGVLGPLLVMGGIAVFISGILTKWRRTSDLHGTAGWARKSEIRSRLS